MICFVHIMTASSAGRRCGSAFISRQERGMGFSLSRSRCSAHMAREQINSAAGGSLNHIAAISRKKKQGHSFCWIPCAEGPRMILTEGSTCIVVSSVQWHETCRSYSSLLGRLPQDLCCSANKTILNSRPRDACLLCNDVGEQHSRPKLVQTCQAYSTVLRCS